MSPSQIEQATGVQNGRASTSSLTESLWHQKLLAQSLTQIKETDIKILKFDPHVVSTFVVGHDANLLALGILYFVFGPLGLSSDTSQMAPREVQIARSWQDLLQSA